MTSEPRGCFGAILGLFAPKNGEQSSEGVAADAKQATFPYRRNERFLSPAESSFLAALRIAVADEYEIFPKVRLIDVLTVRRDGAGYQAAHNRVVAKQIDFLLCERGTSRLMLALELDDSTHKRPDRAARDAFVEEVLEVIGLPVLRVPVTRTYDTREVARLIKASVAEPGE